MAKTKKRKAPKLPVLSVLQHVVLEMLRSGLTLGRIVLASIPELGNNGLESPTRAVNDLAKKGCVSVLVGKSGTKITVEVGPDEYLVKGERYIWPEWRPERVRNVAAAILSDESWDDLPVLADALEEAGCDDVGVLEFLRTPGPAAVSVDEALPMMSRPQPRTAIHAFSEWHIAMEAWIKRRDDRRRYVCPRLLWLRRVRRLCMRLAHVE